MKNLNLSKYLTDPLKEKREFAKKYINDPYASITIKTSDSLVTYLKIKGLK